MRERTDEEIVAKLKAMWPHADGGWGDEGIRVQRHGSNLYLRVTKMYDWDTEEIPVLTFDKRQELSLFFNTMNVETSDEIRNGGCETCDYGSQYGIEILVRPGDPFVNLSESSLDGDKK